MRGLLPQLLRSRAPLTVVVLDAEGAGRPVQHQVHPGRLWMTLAGAALALVVLVAALLLLTPLHRLAPGSSTHSEATGDEARRLAALEDSLQLQQEYIARFRALLSGTPAPPPSASTAAEAPAPAPVPAPRPAIADERNALPGATAAAWTGEPTQRLRPDDAAGLPLPTPAPVQGFLARGFEARTGHFGVDIATTTGAAVRSIGDGFVVFADWTYEGGNTIAVQHADGYLSVYKHNEKLLRRAGERVRARDAIAISGNTGEVTTGPHLHFELWRDGLPQDPRAFVIGW